LTEEDKPRWLIENSQTEEDSDFFNSSGEDDAAHKRNDGCSSAEEENNMKDELRRLAREERDREKQRKLNE
jgi:hypothetical protein